MLDEENIKQALNDYYRDEEKEAFINENIKDKSDIEIKNLLLNIEQNEAGGLIALRGFYYQFLVCLEYITEMLDGHWDFVAIELHDDIVVGYEKKIRFIQVKSGVKPTVIPSEVSSLYLREKKEEGDSTYHINNSWVDKLISKASMFKKENSFETQFQLYTSYHIVKTAINVDKYTDNKDFDIPVHEGDSLYKKLSEATYNRDLSEFNYKEQCGEYLHELLGRFYIKTGPVLNDINKFESYLKDKISNYLFTEGDAQNINISNEDLKMLIGIICSKCIDNGELKSQIFTKESIDEILYTIKTAIMSRVGDFYSANDNKNLIQNSTDILVKEFKDNKLYSEILHSSYSYKDYLDSWIENSGGNVRSIINRFIDGKNNSLTYSNMDKTTKETRLKEVILLANIINTISNQTLEFVDKDWLLTKSKNPSEWFAFFSVGNGNLDRAVSSLGNILESAPLNASLNIQLKDITIVLYNYRDRSFKKNDVRNFDTKMYATDNVLEHSIFSSPKLNTVSIQLRLVPGKELEEAYFDLSNSDNIFEFQKGMHDQWIELGG